LAAFPDDPAALSHERAAAGFAQLQRISELVEAKRLRWLANQERRASYRQDGYLSAAAWLANRFGLRPARPRNRSGWPRHLKRCLG
jgi:hypothetical protein